MEWEFAKDHSFSHRIYSPAAKVITHSGTWRLTNDLLVFATSTNTYVSESGPGTTGSTKNSLDPRMSLAESWTPSGIGVTQTTTTNFLGPQRVRLEGETLTMQPANGSPNVTYYLLKAKTGL